VFVAEAVSLTNCYSNDRPPPSYEAREHIARDGDLIRVHCMLRDIVHQVSRTLGLTHVQEIISFQRTKVPSA